MNARLEQEVFERTEAEVALQNERNLLRRLLYRHEAERKLIAYEIHDGFVQQAVAALMNLQSCEHLGVPASPEAAAALQQSRKLVAESIAEARLLISGLRPASLDDRRRCTSAPASRTGTMERGSRRRSS